MDFENSKTGIVSGFGGMSKKRPSRGDNSSLILSVTAVLLLAIVILSMIFQLVPMKIPFGGLITGNAIFGFNKQANSSSGAGSTYNLTEVKTIKNIKVLADIYTESFEIPVERLDLKIAAEEIEIITPSIELKVKLEKPIVFESFYGSLKWENSILTLEGRLNKYLSEIMNINWKTDEDLKIRIIKGSVEISQINVPRFETIASGTISMGQKVTLKPTKDKLVLDYYRGAFTTIVADNTDKVILEGTAEGMTLGSEQFNFNIE